ncbi:NADP-dependent oxidoreductase domain-containing protein [Fomitopsis serialis]|uniref:NADP-dependent oxidoreductase domain-containing protein n=1 Tax=Fomitopsis serialis TaxID=139415 RepID=UPI002008536E|nr:NADP-dependent oxidoreductase domain-containing protein [Neoantrodia serialis]KAH9937275.1 NADP-dependent oxidoreductase domain-containing protein [Neoantrodia serialis]
MSQHATVALKRTGAKVNRATCADTVYNAIKAGYRLLDGAGDYGLRRAIADGIVKREDLWNTFHARDHYVDPAHRYPPEWWGDDKKVTSPRFPCRRLGPMEELVDLGLAKNIGVSNCQGSILQDILRYSRYEPAVNQVELHPYLTQEPLIKLCKTLGIAITAYSSLGPKATIASKHSKTTAQVLLRWSVQQGLAVIPKSNNHDRLVQNLDVDQFTLGEDEIKAISSLNINLRLNDPAEIDPRMAIFA